MSGSSNNIEVSLAYRLRLASAGERVVGAYGGHPRGIRHADWPMCGVCGAPLCHMAQMDAGPWLDLGYFKRMTVFICHATGGRCRDWEPNGGANRVILHGLLDDDLYDGPAVVRVYRRHMLTIELGVDENVLLAKQLELAEGGEEALDAISYDKIGGIPAWLYEAKPSLMSTSPENCRLVLQMTRDIIPFDITEGGVAYVFFDPSGEAKDGAVMLWQSGSEQI